MRRGNKPGGGRRTHHLGKAGEGLVSKTKETDRPRCAHFLKTAEGKTCQHTERNRPSEARSHPGDGRGRDLSENGKKLAEGDILTA